MNSEVDKEFAHVIFQTLQLCLSPDKALIESAEQQLTVLQERQEYCYILLNFILDQSVEFGIRQMASVLFKQYVDTHWNKNSEKFKEPEVNDAVKQQIKLRLPIGLSDQSSKIRSIVAYSVASIAQWDWPELWPELFGILLSLLDGSNNPNNVIDLNGVHGSLETLTDIVQEVTDIQMPQVAPAIIPQMYKIFIDPQNYSINLRKMSVEIFTRLVIVISEMSEYDSTAGKKYLFPYMNDFMFAMIKALSLTPAESVNLVDNALKSEIIKALTALLKSYPKKLTSKIDEILAQVWTCLVQSSEVYSNKVVNSDSFEGDSCEDERTDLENLVYQLFDFIIELKEKSRYRSIIKKAIDELCYYTILYMQITDDRIENWVSNPEQFVQDEDEDSYSYSVRISGQELIESIASDFKKDTANAVLKAIERHMVLAQKLKEANNANWWKIHEACLLAFSSVKPILQELQNSNKLELDLNKFINEFVIGCLHASDYPFLVGRALFTASRFPKLLNSETLETLLKVTASTVQDNQNPIIRLSAMKSIYCFCEELSVWNQQSILIPHLPQITEGLLQMITQNATNQIGFLTMETLMTVMSIDETFVASMEAKLSPIAIALFLKNSSDPMVNSIITDIIKILICNPHTNAKVEQRLIPTLVSILNTTQGNPDEENYQKNLSTLLTATLDLITAVLRNTKQVPLSEPLVNSFFSVINLCLKSDDTAVLQSGSDCIRAYISKSIDQIVNWKDDKGQSALNYIVLVINHMLDPKTSENGCQNIGKLITTLMRHTAQVLGDNLDFILKAVLSKMQSSDILTIQQSLIMVFAHLLHSKMDAVLLFLSNLPGPTGKPSLEFFMTEWVSKSTMFSGQYDCKVSMLALAKILEHAISTSDQRFQNIFVRGDRIINPVEGIRTRSKVKNEKELYTQVPLLVKVYKLLINELHGLLEEKKDLADDGDYEENDEEGAEDYDDDEYEENENEIEVDENGSEAENINSYLNKFDIFDGAFEKDDAEDDPEALDDPLMKIDLLGYLSQYLKTLSQHPFFPHFVEHHNQLEKEVLKEIGINNA